MAESNVPVETISIGLRQPSERSALRRSPTCDSFVNASALVEVASIIFAAGVSKYFYLDLIIGHNQPVWLYLLPSLLLAVTFYLFMKQAGLYDSSALTGPVLAYGKMFGALAMSFLVVLGILYVLKCAEWYSRGWFLTWFALSALVLVAVRLTIRKRVQQLAASGKMRRRVAIYGTLEFLTKMRADIEAYDPSVVVDGVYLAKPTAVASNDLPFDGGLAELKQALARKVYDAVFIGMPAQDTPRIQSAVNGLASYSIELSLCTELDPYPVVVHGSRNFGPLRTNIVNLVPLSETHGFLKRSLDCVVATVGLICLAPMFAVVALLVKLDSPGPVFFRQRRYGQNNEVFRIFKFRTMAVTEDGNHVKQAERNDPRVTRIGRFLRRTSIDELPQLLNVLTGDMSIVGPRPHALAHDQIFEEKLDLFSRRRRVRPGLTGWAQVHGFRGETKTTEDIRSRMQYDLYYIDNWSIWLDVEIMTRTVFVLFRGAY
jgi:Undecaprenyl-phosphate glucose phosphotransferase